MFLKRDANDRKTTVMWRIVSYIHIHILEHSEKADYGKYVFEELSKELAIGKRTLYRAVQFYKAYPDSVSPVTRLSWKHFIILLSVDNKVKRNEYEKIVLKENLSKRKLLELVRKGRKQLTSSEHAQLKTLRGRPGVYRLKNIGSVLILDCGFYTYLERPELSAVKNPETYVEYDDSSTYKLIEPDKSLLYTFKATIVEVIDGDTVKAFLDIGFGIKVIRTLRLRGINAQDLHSKKGREAKEYIEAKVLNLPFVIIQTHSRDKYLRYLADIFYLKGNEDIHNVAQKGKYLNQELMDESLADRYWKW